MSRGSVCVWRADSFPWDLEGKQETQTQLRVKGGSKRGQRRDLDYPVLQNSIQLPPIYVILHYKSAIMFTVVM